MPVVLPKSSSRSLMLIAAATLLGLALQANDGLFSPAAIGLLIATLLCLCGTLWPKKLIEEATLNGALRFAVLIQLAVGFTKVAGASAATVAPVSQWPYHVGLVLAALVVLAPRCPDRIRGGLLLVIFVGVGIRKIHSAPHPKIDVYDFQTDAPRALLHGINPYAITFPNIYGPQTTVYGPGIAQDGRLLFGYPYPPLVLYWVTPAVALVNDFRYAQLLAVALAGLLLARRGGSLLAALLLFSPRTFYVIESGWTEPLSVMLLIAVCTVGRRRTEFYSARNMVRAILFGLLLASKQYCPALILLAPMLFARTTMLRSLVIAGTAAFLVTAPLALWSWHSFVHSAILLQLHQPYRPDALSILAWIGTHNPAFSPPSWLAFVTLIIAAALSLRRRVDFAAAAALTLACFFAFNKQAFANYYFLVIGACCAGVLQQKLQRLAPPVDKKLSDYAHPPADTLSLSARDPAVGTAG